MLKAKVRPKPETRSSDGSPALPAGQPPVHCRRLPISLRFLVEAARFEDITKAVGPEAAGERLRHVMHRFR